MGFESEIARARSAASPERVSFQEIAELEPGSHEVWLEFEREIIALERFLKAALMLQQRAEIREILGVGGVVADRLGDCFNAEIQPVGRRIHQAEQVQRVGVGRISR